MNDPIRKDDVTEEPTVAPQRRNRLHQPAVHPFWPTVWMMIWISILVMVGALIAGFTVQQAHDLWDVGQDIGKIL